MAHKYKFPNEGPLSCHEPGGGDPVVDKLRELGFTEDEIIDRRGGRLRQLKQIGDRECHCGTHRERIIMDKSRVGPLFNEFAKGYNQEEKDGIWNRQSSTFRLFWKEKILASTAKELNDQECDEIIRLLDINGKGNTKSSEAVAKVLTPQGAWRRMLNQIHSSKKLSGAVTSVLEEQNLDARGKCIDQLYEINSGNKNSLTGKSGNAINAFLALYDPVANLSIVSLKDRRKLIEFLCISAGVMFDSNSVGANIAQSSRVILDFFQACGINASARTISCFCYSSQMKGLWKVDKEEPPAPPDDGSEPAGVDIQDKLLFYMESQLEDFLIENWDKTELGKKLDLIEEDGDLVSQQYQTAIGKIDILARDKKSGKFVIIELKRNQSSDDTVGQLARYMGWVEEHRSQGIPSKGIIVAGKYDERLYYAIKKVPDVEVYLYKVDFKLERLEKPA